MLEARNSIWRSLFQIMISALFVVMGWTILTPDVINNPIPWLTVIFFSGTMLRGVYLLFDRRAKILLDQHGVYFPGRHPTIISWEEITHFKADSSKHDISIEIDLKNKDLLDFKFFFLNVSCEQLNQCALQAIRRVRREKRAKLGYEAAISETAGEYSKNESKDSEMAWMHSSEALSAEDADEIDDDYDSKEIEESILKEHWLLPPWFSDDRIINEMTWVWVLASGVSAMIMVMSWYDPGGPPKISIFAQVVFVVAMGPVFMLIWYLLNLEDYTKYRSRWPSGTETNLEKRSHAKKRKDKKKQKQERIY